jgi:uncharacterized protein YndB with AHSA1/START domain
MTKLEPIAVERSIWIDAPPEKVWPALTDPEKLTQWYATRFKWAIPTLAVGATATFFNGVDEPLTAVIDVLDPPREFRLRWAAYGETPALVTAFLLIPENGGTRATIRESGYEAVPPEERQQWLEATGSGYAKSVENLKAFCEGRRLPY